MCWEDVKIARQQFVSDVRANTALALGTQTFNANTRRVRFIFSCYYQSTVDDMPFLRVGTDPFFIDPTKLLVATNLSIPFVMDIYNFGANTISRTLYAVINASALSTGQASMVEVSLLDPLDQGIPVTQTPGG